MGQVLGKLGLIMLISQQFCSLVSNCESSQTNGNYLKQKVFILQLKVPIKSTNQQDTMS